MSARMVQVECACGECTIWAEQNGRAVPLRALAPAGPGIVSPHMAVRIAHDDVSHSAAYLREAFGYQPVQGTQEASTATTASGRHPDYSTRLQCDCETCGGMVGWTLEQNLTGAATAHGLLQMAITLGHSQRAVILEGRPRTVTLSPAAFDLLCNLVDANDDVAQLLASGLTDSPIARDDLVAALAEAGSWS